MIAFAFAGLADLQFQVQGLNSFDCGGGAVAAAESDLVETDFALELGRGLGILQRNNAAGFFDALAGLIDADDPEGGPVDAQVVADRDIDRFGCTPADHHLPGTAHRFALDDAIVVHGSAADFVAEEEEEGQPRGCNPGVDAGFHPVHAGNGKQTLADSLVDAAEGGVHRPGLGDQQVVAAATDNEGEVCGYTFCDGAERNDGGDANGDAEEGQAASDRSSRQVLQYHLRSVVRKRSTVCPPETASA